MNIRAHRPADGARQHAQARHNKTIQEEPMPAAVFIVRSTVADPAKRTAFDKWYRTELLPDAVKSFRVKKAWRVWSLADPAIHQAIYHFEDEAALDRAMKEEVPRLITKFVRDWPDVPRIRETFVLAQEFGT
jgi:hypothetical protein